MISTDLYHRMKKEVELKRSYEFFAEKYLDFCSQHEITAYFETPNATECSVKVRLHHENAR
jgi:hypothetical protein